MIHNKLIKKYFFKKVWIQVTRLGIKTAFRGHRVLNKSLTGGMCCLPRSCWLRKPLKSPQVDRQLSLLVSCTPKLHSKIYLAPRMYRNQVGSSLEASYNWIALVVPSRKCSADHWGRKAIACLTQHWSLGCYNTDQLRVKTSPLVWEGEIC